MKNIITLFAGALMLFSTYEVEAARALVQYNFSDGARDFAGGTGQIRSRMRNGHNQTNSTHNNSRTNGSVGIAIMRRQPGINDRNVNLGQSYDNLRFGRLQGQRRDEQNRRADIAMIVTNGAGFLGNTAINGAAQQNGAYGSVLARRSGTTTMSHELGHIYNCAHNQAGPPMNAGGLRRYTIMRVGVNDSRVPYYSNPSVRWRGANTSCCGRNNAGRARGVQNAKANRR